MTEQKPKTENEITLDLISKSEEEFEKKLTYIGAGALLLSLTFIDKIISLESSYYIGFLISGWATLTLSLLSNLMSHLLAKIQFRKVQSELRKGIPYEIRLKKYKKRILFTESVNWLSVISLVVGICLIIMFASANALNSAEKNKESNVKDTLNVRILST